MPNLAEKPPFRADHVGSLLRPKELLQARADPDPGKISGAGFGPFLVPI